MCQLDRHCWLVKCSVDVVDWDGIVRVRCVTGDVANDRELACGRGEGLGVNEGWDLGRQVDAVDEHVRLDDLLVWARLSLCLWKIPFLVALALDGNLESSLCLR